MLFELKKENNYTKTENGAVAFKSSLNFCLDLFATCGSLRNASEKDIVNRFIRAYTENPDIAMKILFYCRDIREGLGERRFFNVVIKYLCDKHPKTIEKNLGLFAEYGRYDDILELFDTPCELVAKDYLKKMFFEDLNNLENNKPISLCAKWLPSINTSNKEKVRFGRKIAKYFDLSEKEYRQNLSKLRRNINIIENYLREKDYSFYYEKLPSKAALKYRKAFCRNDWDRYSEYLSKVRKNDSKMNTDTLMPYEIVNPFYSFNGWFGRVSDQEAISLDTTWKALPDFTDDTNALVVIDTSGSMLWNRPGNPLPMTVATSLGLYFAERTEGEFKNHFIMFSETPQLIEIKGSTLQEKLEYIATFNEVADTNMEAVFDLILNAALNNKVKREEMPTRIFIVSDMEFNQGISNADI